jgi:hypothetical protein
MGVSSLDGYKKETHYVLTTLSRHNGRRLFSSQGATLKNGKANTHNYS